MGRGRYQSPMEFWVSIRAKSEADKSDFRHGEEPRYTGFKRNYRKAKWRPTLKGDKLWCERYESVSKCWKDQSKRRHQYKPIVFA